MPDYTEHAMPPVVPASADSGVESITVPGLSGAGLRLDKFLASRLTDVSRTRIQKWIALGAVRIDDQPVTGKQKLIGFESIEVDLLPLEADVSFEPDPVDLTIHAENDDFVVINKQAGLVVHPGHGHWRNTLMNGLLFHFPDIAVLPRAGIVHRLDKDTTGLMVVAKTEAMRSYFMGLLARHDVQRTYWALVWGVAPKLGIVNQPMARDPHNKLRMAVVPDGNVSKASKAAVTHFKTLALGKLKSRDVSLVELQLETGRTHQIRVHMQWLGFPLVGDPVYGNTLKGAKPGDCGDFNRQALHAKKLSFKNAANAKANGGEVCTFEASLPSDFSALLALSGVAFE
jgi:23S rRNA pseudouridine1911/1915/1917 synthase